MIRSMLATVSLAALLALSACDSDDDDAAPEADAQGDMLLPGEDPDTASPGDSTLNPDLPAQPPSEEPSGDDTTAIAGLWNAASSDPEGRRDEKYVSISADGLYTTYDFQQDEVTNGEMCYVVAPRRLDLETGEAASGTYSVSGQRGFTVTPSDDADTLIVTFIDAETGESAPDAVPETWPRVIGDTVENLTLCDEG